MAPAQFVRWPGAPLCRSVGNLIEHGEVDASPGTYFQVALCALVAGAALEPVLLSAGVLRSASAALHVIIECACV